MKATALGIWYQQIPGGYVVNPQGEVVEPKEHNGSKFVWVKRKRKTINSMPKLNYKDAMDFKKVFVDKEWAITSPKQNKSLP